MAVYVDELRPVAKRAGFCGERVKDACHLMADTPDELEPFRKRLGLRRSWRHGDHYDLTEGKRLRAIQLGAIEVMSRQLVALRMRKRQASALDPRDAEVGEDVDE